MHTQAHSDIPTCSICLLPMASQLSALKCGHIFHTSCINRCLEYQQKCPYCNAVASKSWKIVYEIGEKIVKKQARSNINELAKLEVKKFERTIKSQNQQIVRLKTRLQAIQSQYETLETQNRVLSHKNRVLVDQYTNSQKQILKLQEQMKAKKKNQAKTTLQFPNKANPEQLKCQKQYQQLQKWLNFLDLSPEQRIKQYQQFIRLVILDEIKLKQSLQKPSAPTPAARSVFAHSYDHLSDQSSPQQASREGKQAQQNLKINFKYGKRN